MTFSGIAEATLMADHAASVRKISIIVLHKNTPAQYVTACGGSGRQDAKYDVDWLPGATFR